MKSVLRCKILLLQAIDHVFEVGNDRLESISNDLSSKLIIRFGIILHVRVYFAIAVTAITITILAVTVIAITVFLFVPDQLANVGYEFTAGVFHFRNEKGYCLCVTRSESQKIVQSRPRYVYGGASMNDHTFSVFDV